MEISGKVVSILPEQSGQGQKGGWRKQEYIIETQDQYPKKVCVALWGEKIDQYSLKEGEVVNAHVNVESREFNGRWYTDVKAWKVDKQGGSEPSGFQPDPVYTEQQQSFPPPAAPLPDDEDDLPF